MKRIMEKQIPLEKGSGDADSRVEEACRQESEAGDEAYISLGR
jgi:hypothetical protein